MSEHYAIRLTNPTVIKTIVGGPPGPTGPQGPPGPPGDGTYSPEYFNYVQSTPSDTWVIHHYLGFMPSITVMDSAGSVIEGDIVSYDNNTVTLHFSGAFSGVACLS